MMPSRKKLLCFGGAMLVYLAVTGIALSTSDHYRGLVSPVGHEEASGLFGASCVQVANLNICSGVCGYKYLDVAGIAVKDCYTQTENQPLCNAMTECRDDQHYTIDT